MENISGMHDEQGHHECMVKVLEVLHEFSPFVLKNGHSDEKLRSIAASIVANLLLGTHAKLNVCLTAPEGVYTDEEVNMAAADAMRLHRLSLAIGD